MKKKILLILIFLFVFVSISGCNIDNNRKGSSSQNKISEESSSPELKEIDKNIKNNKRKTLISEKEITKEYRNFFNFLLKLN